MLAGKCNCSYICNTISAYHKEPVQKALVQDDQRASKTLTPVSGTYKDDDSRYSLKNLLQRQEMEASHE